MNAATAEIRQEVDMSKRYGSVEQRFWSNVVGEPNSGCWLWMGPVDENGYARFRVGARKARMHRWAFETLVRPLSRSEIVCHKCDVPACVNPSHMFIGSQRDNVEDKVKKGRQSVGRKSPCAKLTEDQVRDIRASDETNRALGRKYGVTHGIIGKIKNREDWKHVQ